MSEQRIGEVSMQLTNRKSSISARCSAPPSSTPVKQTVGSRLW